ncbi:MAG TPA: AMP-binding protein [Acidimicrobiales bacterium]|nr:AMP-binding protein [Acidimicrobiales bacterium]
MRAEGSYISGPSTVPLSGATIGEQLRRTAVEHASAEALVECWTGRRWDWAALDAEVDAVARGLIGAGVDRGARVGVWSPNCAEWMFLQLATARVGAILVTVNPAYRTSELAYVLRQSGTSLLVTGATTERADYRGMVAEVADDCPGLERVVVFGDRTWAQLVADGGGVTDAQLAERESALSCDDPINIQYTSGTTGSPKGATLSHHNILNNALFVAELLGYTEADRICVPVPYYHCFGLGMGNLAALSTGATVILPSPTFDPGASLAAVQDEKATSLYGVPTMFIAELAHPDFAGFDLSSLRTGIMAGSPCPVEVMKKVVTSMNMEEVAICYGMTETSPVSTMTRADDDLDRRTATVGTVMPHLEVKVVDPATGATVPRGEPGELCTRGYSVMLGYWEDPDATARAIDRARWMHTGDLAVMREDGYVNIVGRIKDVVIRGGENIYPREVEEFLYTHPDVVDVQVVGVPDGRYGEELCAWVRMRDGTPPLDAGTLREFCAGRLAHYKIPRYVHITDSFPMTVTGKIRKVEMRERSVELLGLQAEAAARHA